MCIFGQTSHTRNNIMFVFTQDANASYDFVHYDTDPTPDENDEDPNSHGTSCAGEVAMSRNCSCGVGVAYGSKIGGNTVYYGYVHKFYRRM